MRLRIAAVQQNFLGLRVTEEYTSDDGLVIVWDATIDGRAAAGADLIRVNAEGRISEIIVFIRPLDAVSGAAAVIGRQVASRRSRAHGAAMVFMTRPLVSCIRIGDKLTPHLLGYARTRRARRREKTTA
ncbi:hypothetical protein ACIRRA_05820 [Nocardia sp. NPDC101769]|uniref:hypothetical protein n=1 Tax=Nocardia sp. NPDC101769 TaxID=3364333 RepID=UPI0037F4B193